MFKQFAAKYPEYEVFTPQTKQTYLLRTMTVAEEERLKGSWISPTRLTEHLNRCIYDCIVKRPDGIKDYTTFIKNTTMKDREALLYGLYHVTYEEIRNYEIKCTSCDKKYSVTIDASKTFNYNLYPEDNTVLTKIIPIQLKKTSGVTCYIKQPTLFDEQNNSKLVRPGATQELITETMIITKFEELSEQSKEAVVYDDRSDIIDAYITLPPYDKRQIFEEYTNNFGQYGINLKMICNCTNCGYSEEVEIDLLSQFFRMVLTS